MFVLSFCSFLEGQQREKSFSTPCACSDGFQGGVSLKVVGCSCPMQSK